MRIVVIGAEQVMSPTSSEGRCPECRKHFKAGEVAVTFSQGPGVYVHPNLYVHRHHFDAVLADAPTDAAVIDAEVRAVVADYRVAGRTAVDVLLDA